VTPAPAAAATVVLHQFARSHFNEKARWALAWKRIAHRRVTHLPGPHAPRMLRLSGTTTTPVLVLDGTVIAGSAAIVDALERRFPDPALYPADPALRARALAVQERLDREVGPAVRTVAFSALVAEPRYVRRIFAEGKLAPVRALYAAGFPLVGRLIARANGADDPATIARAFETTERALDEIAGEIAATGHLVGATFGVADLTAAALLAILADPEHPDMRLPRPVPARVAALLARYAPHPAVAWVREQYRLRRGTEPSLDAAERTARPCAQR
jgi:glutathione S-transferase